MATKTKKTDVSKEIEVLPADALAVVTQGLGLVEFLQKLATFFLQATSLEANAKATLSSATQLKVPTTKEEDAAVQEFIRGARRLRQEVEGHWEITSAISRFHKTLTSKRAIATDACKSAEDIATRQHTTYVTNETRRAEQERQRLQREEDERAERARQEKLAEFEAAAVKAEESSPTLSEREQCFVDFVVRGSAPHKAAGLAGYKDPVAQAARLSTSPKIKAAIEAIRTAESLRTQVEIMKEAPLPADTIEVKAELNKGDRWSWTARVLNLELLRAEAFRNPNSGIPLDIFMVDQTKLNSYAKALQENINRWPGVEGVKKNTVV
jgi:hypothetical protein